MSAYTLQAMRRKISRTEAPNVVALLTPEPFRRTRSYHCRRPYDMTNVVKVQFRRAPAPLPDPASSDFEATMAARIRAIYGDWRIAKGYGPEDGGAA